MAIANYISTPNGLWDLGHRVNATELSVLTRRRATPEAA